MLIQGLWGDCYLPNIRIKLRERFTVKFVEFIWAGLLSQLLPIIATAIELRIIINFHWKSLEFIAQKYQIHNRSLHQLSAFNQINVNCMYEPIKRNQQQSTIWCANKFTEHFIVVFKTKAASDDSNALFQSLDHRIQFLIISLRLLELVYATDYRATGLQNGYGLGMAPIVDWCEEYENF